MRTSGGSGIGRGQASVPNAMPLADYFTKVMEMLTTQPDATEICVERVKPLRFAERSGSYEAFFMRHSSRTSTMRWRKARQGNRRRDR